MECKPGSQQQQALEEQSRLKSFLSEGIVPDALDAPPSSLLGISYRVGIAANLGNQLAAHDVVEVPKIVWTANTEAFYTLIAIDLDAPSRAQPVNREYQHWLVVNIRGGDVTRGETLTEYKPPNPPAGSGPHRYVFLIIKQAGRVKFQEPHLSLNATAVPGAPNRMHFNLRQFMKKYGLDEVVAGNFFEVQTSSA